MKKTKHNNCIFQQDNAPCHTSQLKRRYFEENEIQLINWLAQSSDLNPIENIWAILKNRLLKKNIKTVDLLKKEIDIEWHNIKESETKKLARSMLKRCIDFIKSGDGPTKY